MGAIYEVGALCALDEAIDGLSLADLDVYVGVSSGAILGATLANGVTPHTISRAVIGKATPELNLDPSTLFTPALSEYADRVARLPRAVYQTLRQALQHPMDLSMAGVIAGLGQVVPVGLFTNAPLQAYMAQAFDTEGRTDDFRALRAALRVVAVNLDTAELVAFGDDATAGVPISKAVQASTALPGLYVPVAIDGERYIDGVARRTVHASVALDAGAELLFCINPIVPVNLREGEPDVPAEALVDHGLPTVLSQTFRTIIHSRMRTGFKKYEHTYPDADIVLIEPEVADRRMFFANIFSFADRQALCEHAYAATWRSLLKQADTLAPILERHGLALRLDLLQDGTRTLYGPAHTKAASPSPSAQRVQDVLHRLDDALSKTHQRTQGKVSP